MVAAVTRLPEEVSRTQRIALLWLGWILGGAVAYGMGKFFATVYLGASFVEGRVGLIPITGALIALLSLVTFYALRRTMRDAHSRAL
jgi:hypothetical protein